MTTFILAWHGLLALFHSVHVPHSLLGRQGLEVEESFHRDHHLLKFLRNSVQQPLNHLFATDLLTENAKLIRDGVERQSKKSSTDSLGLKAISPNSRLSCSAFASLT
jgi:hypothetical protein